MRLYTDLSPWYRLLTPVADYADEAALYTTLLQGQLGPGRHRLLELGAGAGHNASHMKAHFDLTLSDLSPQMLALSASLNPELPHLQGDLRTLRLDETFDAVFLHDAIVYMLDESDLRAALTSAWVHTRPGGAALFAFDVLADGFTGSTDCGGSDGEDGRALRYLEWSWDPDPTDTTCICDYVLVLRTGDAVETVVDRHIEGIFPRATWLRLLDEVGFVVVHEQAIDLEDDAGHLFLCRRPVAP